MLIQQSFVIESWCRREERRWERESWSERVRIVANDSEKEGWVKKRVLWSCMSRKSRYTRDSTTMTHFMGKSSRDSSFVLVKLGDSSTSCTCLGFVQASNSQLCEKWHFVLLALHHFPSWFWNHEIMTHKVLVINATRCHKCGGPNAQVWNCHIVQFYNTSFFPPL